LRPQHGDRPLHVADRDVERVADAQIARRLDGVAVELDVAAMDRLRGERAGLEEAGAPQPFVDAQAGERSLFGAMVVIDSVAC
jgi:hypothetical protein